MMEVFGTLGYCVTFCHFVDCFFFFDWNPGVPKSEIGINDLSYVGRFKVVFGMKVDTSYFLPSLLWTSLSSSSSSSSTAAAAAQSLSFADHHSSCVGIMFASSLPVQSHWVHPIFAVVDLGEDVRPNALPELWYRWRPDPAHTVEDTERRAGQHSAQGMCNKN